ncbi:MAG: TerC/Alx family metal homeostasis membrane protein [Holosporaceae bacterium]|nr:TerC/Alx family metal homeostasis membrane protein [Holosporaceae bacterium]
MKDIIFFSEFSVLILLLVAADFYYTERHPRPSSAMFLTFLWIFLGLGFSVFPYVFYGLDAFFEYLTAYCLEKSLSVDNIFVFLLIFQKFKIEKEYQRRLLFVGICSALVLRLIMICLLGQIISSFHFMISLFGLMLLFAGFQAIFRKSVGPNDALLKRLEKYFKIYAGDHGGRFLIFENGKIMITILTAAIICLEVCDVIFAFDSIPALFSVTENKLIIYSSNAFAIIGLRSLYMILATFVDKFRYLKSGIGVVLCLVGLKMIVSDYLYFSPSMYLAIIFTILLAAVVFSLIHDYSGQKSGEKE